MYLHCVAMESSNTRVLSRVLGSVCVADPAFNSCRDPGTPAFGIPILAQGFQVGEPGCAHTEEHFNLS